MDFICAFCITVILICLAIVVIGFTTMAVINMIIEVIDNIKYR